jgi:hypothetical protein
MLGLSANHFTGQIPSEIALLTSLFELGLGENAFTGSIPEEIYFSGMNHLNALILGENRLSGSINSKHQGLCCPLLLPCAWFNSRPNKLPFLFAIDTLPLLLQQLI